MPRSLRLEFPGAFYHVMARGNRRETIFHDDDDRRFFLATLSEACAMTGWRVHAWVLMGNHYHLFIETPEANLVAGMSWLQNTVTRRHNVRHLAWGRLFGDRYKAVLVDGADTYHYRTLADYIHLNPVHPHDGRLALFGRDHRPVLTPDRRLGPRRPHAHRARHRCPQASSRFAHHRPGADLPQ